MYLFHREVSIFIFCILAFLYVTPAHSRKNQDRGRCRLAPQTAIKSGDRHIFWRQPNNLATARISGDKFWRRQNLICVEFIIYVGISIINSTHEEVFHVKFHKKFWRQVLASPDFWRPPDYLAVARFSGGLGVHPRTNPPQSCFFLQRQ